MEKEKAVTDDRDSFTGGSGYISLDCGAMLTIGVITVRCGLPDGHDRSGIPHEGIPDPMPIRWGAGHAPRAVHEEGGSPLGAVLENRTPEETNAMQHIVDMLDGENAG